MKALIYTGTKTLEYSDRPDPIPRLINGEVEALIRVEASGICGSDVLAYLGKDPRRVAPLVLGHEAAGTIVEGPRAGERVAINPLVTCGECDACINGQTNICPMREIISIAPRDGALAQIVTAPYSNLVTVPDDVPFEKACLVEPMSCGWHIARLCRRAVPRGRSGLVIGGGAIGLCAALSLKAQGVTDVKIVEANPLRAGFLRQTCGQTVVSENALSDTATFDIIVDAVGLATTRKLACAQVEAGGVIGHMGLGDNLDGLDTRRMTLDEITFIGTYTYSAHDFESTAAAMWDGRLGDLAWAEQRPLSSGSAAFNDICNGTVAAPRIVLRPH